MFRELESLADSMRRYAARLDVGADDTAELSAGEAARLVDVFAEIERLAALCRTRAAARVAASQVWREHGDRSPAHWLARRAGTSVRRAGEDLVTAAAARELPGTAEALGEGSLSLGQAAHVARAASVDPAAEGELLATASSGSMAELKKLADRREAAGLPDFEDRQRRVRQGRYFRHFSDHLGGFRAELCTTPQHGARLLAGLRPWFRQLSRTAHAAGEDEPVEALMVDALVQACSTTTPPGPPQPAATVESPGSEPGDHAGRDAKGGGRYRDCKVIVRVDHDALQRGHTHPGETCEAAGVGPLSVSAVREMITGGAFVAAVVTRATDIVGVTHLGRRPTAAQMTALQWRDTQCCAQGCPADGYLEIDHRTGWAQTRQTRLKHLDGLCSHHHHLKTNHGYRLDPGTGKRPMRPPPPNDEPP